MLPDPIRYPALCAAKAEVADCAVQVVNEAMTLMGGIAYRSGAKMDRFLRDVRASYDGTHHRHPPHTDGPSLIGSAAVGGLV